MKNVFFSILVSICLCQPVLSNTIEADFHSFDSLLLEGKLDILQVELEKSKSNISNFNDSTIFLNKFNTYSQIINFKQNFINQDSTVLLNFIKNKKAERDFFKKSFAGEHAFLSYSKFLKNSDANNHIDAAKYYFIANYFRSKFIDSSISTIKLVYKQAQEKFNESKYKESLEYIQANQIDAGNNYVLKSYNDSLMAISEASIRKQKTIDDKELYWSSTKKVNKNWYLSIGLHSIFQPAHDKISFDFSEQSPSAIYNSGYISKQNNFALSLELSHNLSERFGVGGDVMLSKSTYRSELDLKLIYFDYSYDILTSHFKGICYLRKHVGFRPYVALGGGYFRANRSESEVKIVTVTPSSQITDIYTHPQKTITSFQSLYEFGVQFISDENSNIFININSTFYKNHNDDPDIKSSYNSFAITVGLLF